MKRKIKRSFLLLVLLVLILTQFSSESLRENSVIHIACVGDSITYGAKIKDKSVNSYPARLQQALGKKYLVQNFGASGYTLQKNGNFPYWEHPNFQKSTDFQPDMVLIMLGTNDSKPQNWTDTSTFTKDYKRLIEHYQSLESKPQIFLMTPATVFPQHLRPEDNYQIQASTVNLIAETVRKLAEEENLPLIDINQTTRSHPEYFSGDGIHPDAVGANLIAKTACKAILNPK